MMVEPFFSVIIPTYNRAKFIKKAIDSVLAQDFSDFEVIVVDDGSKDNTREVVTSIGDTRIRYHYKENEERAAARNTGVEMAKGKYVNFLDSDDVVYPIHLSTAYGFIHSARHFPEVFHQAYDFKNVAGEVVSQSAELKNIGNLLLDGNVLSCNGVFIRHDIASQNRFNELRALSSLEDWELWLRLSTKFTIHPVHTITSTVVWHDSRSVITGDVQAVKTKVEAFVGVILNSRELYRRANKPAKKIISSAFTYAALHIAMAGGSTSDVMPYWFKGIKLNILNFVSRRTLATFKILLTKGVKKKA